MTLPVSVLLRPLAELKEDEWAVAEITVNNYGEEPIKFLKIEVFGDIEMEKPLQIDALGPDELLSYQVRIRVLSADGVAVIKASKIEEGNVVEFMATTMRLPCISAKRTERKGFKKYAAYQEETCKHCQEKIYPGFLVVHCGCNAVFHHKCVQDFKCCPVCGRNWK
ncbi:MAG: hypothetical protein N3F63_07465 [Thermoplasmata archaeon]|nr:hypothetical protein [Thermoplasmata archaeon]